MPKKNDKPKKNKKNTKKLLSPKTITLEVTDVEITSLVHDFERDSLEINYITMLSDGRPYQRGRELLTDDADVQAFYDLLDASVASGKKVRDAVDDKITEKILGAI